MVSRETAALDGGSILTELRNMRAWLEAVVLSPAMLTVKFATAAKMMGVTPRTISNMVRRGQLNPVLVSGTKMILVAELRLIATPPTERKPSAAKRRAVSSGAGVKGEVEAMLRRR